MPNVEVRSYDGYFYRCDSSNPATIAAFLGEIAQRFATANPADGPLQVWIRPLSIWSHEQQRRIFDWDPSGTQTWEIEPYEFIPRLIEILQ